MCKIHRAGSKCIYIGWMSIGLVVDIVLCAKLLSCILEELCEGVSLMRVAGSGVVSQKQVDKCS